MSNVKIGTPPARAAESPLPWAGGATAPQTRVARPAWGPSPAAGGAPPRDRVRAPARSVGGGHLRSGSGCAGALQPTHLNPARTMAPPREAHHKTHARTPLPPACVNSEPPAAASVPPGKVPGQLLLHTRLRGWLLCVQRRAAGLLHPAGRGGLPLHAA